MRIRIIIVIVLIGIFSCTKKEKLDVDTSKINVEIKVKRFEQVFYKASPSELPKIKREYRYLFPHDIDSIWIKKMHNKDEQELFAATQTIYPNLDVVGTKLEALFKHVKYYYPKFKEPKIVTINSNVDLEQKVVYADSLLFISLDAYLGEDSKIYQDYPAYIKQNLTKEHLIVNVAEELTRPILFRSNDRRFLAKIIQEGKKMYALDAFLPKETEANKIGYTKAQLTWIKENEAMIWQYFLEKKMLYDTSKDLEKRFIMYAPFTKFYLDIDSESPGSVGVWIGWQIVRSYMQHNDIKLTELMRLDNEEIFKKSKYRPKNN